MASIFPQIPVRIGASYGSCRFLHINNKKTVLFCRMLRQIYKKTFTFESKSDMI